METSITFPFEQDVEEMRGAAKIRPYGRFNSTNARQREVWAIVAAARKGEIGINGDMPWHISADLKRFRTLTMGHPVIMGRRTWESIPSSRRPLAGRRNIVISSNLEFSPEGAERASGIEEAIALCDAADVPVIIGGGSIYAAAMPYVTRLHLTRVEAEYPDADTFFPLPDEKEWELTAISPTEETPEKLRFRFEEYARKEKR